MGQPTHTLHDIARHRLSALASVEKDWYFTHKAWNAYIKAIIGNRGRKGKKRQQYVNDTTCGFLNVQGMGDNVFRRYLLSQYRKRYHIFAAAETWCPGPEKEKEWAKDWKGSGGVVWASAPPEAADNLYGYKGRGIGIFFANCLGEVVEKSEQIVRDPQGRFLAISCTLHGRPH